ncbi:MAG: hypothetical protein KC609_12780 [Myxococcales bacterium]|nr:hypothetical protein [Myxococcales bacterium]
MRRTIAIACLGAALVFGACTTSKVPSSDNDGASDSSGVVDTTSGTDTGTTGDDTATGNDTSSTGNDTSSTGNDTSANDVSGSEDSSVSDSVDTTGPVKQPCSDISKLDPLKKKIGEPCTTNDECQTNNCFSEEWVNGFKFCTARCDACAGDSGVCSAWPGVTGYDNRCLRMTAAGANQSGYKAFCIANCGKVGMLGDDLCAKLSASTTWSCQFPDFPELSGATVYPTCLP